MGRYAQMPINDYQDICDAVRAKTGETGELVSGDVADAIAGISGGGGAQVYTISGTGSAAVAVTDPIKAFSRFDSEGNLSIVSAVQIKLGSKSARAMWRSTDGANNQVTFAGASDMGDTTAVFGYTADGFNITTVQPVSLQIGSTDYTPYIRQIVWTITVFDNSGA